MHLSVILSLRSNGRRIDSKPESVANTLHPGRSLTRVVPSYGVKTYQSNSLKTPRIRRRFGRMKALLTFLLVFCTAAASAQELAGTVVGITDGDTLTLLDATRHQYKIRLTEIDTPEKGQPWGTKAKDALGEKVFKQQVTVVSSGNDRYGRVLGRVYLGDRDINREMVAEGHAWAYRQYLTDESFLKDEAKARESGIGLWSVPNPVPPWEWRGGSKGRIVKRSAQTAPGEFSCGAEAILQGNDQLFRG